MKLSTLFQGRRLSFASIFLACALSAGAQTQISSLGDTFSSSIGVNVNEWVGIAFTTDSHSYTLDSITAPIYYNTAGTLDAMLYTGTGNDATGSAFASFTYGAIPLNNAASVTFTPGSPVTLTANTTYVFVLGAAGAGTWGWSSTAQNSSYTTAPGGAWTGGTTTTLSFDQGVSFGPFYTLTDQAQIAVNATPVPEPASYAALMGCLALGLVYVRRRGLAQFPAGT